MTFLILVIIIVISLLTYSFFKEHVFLVELRKRESSLNQMLLINSGKKIHAFTIENSQFIIGDAVYSVGNIYKAILKILRTFNINSKLDNYLGALAIKDAIVKMKEHAADADYIVDVKFEVCFLSTGKVAAHAYGTAIYLYKDTLGLFDYPENIKFSVFNKIRSLFLQRTLKLFFVGLIGVMLVYNTYCNITSLVLDNFSLENEKVAWSFIEDSVLETRVIGQKLLQIEDQVQNLLTNINLPGGKNNEYKIFLLNDNYKSEINIYPHGNITLTAGIFKKVHSQDQLAFLLAHAIAHDYYGDILKKQGISLINMYLATQFFSEKSIFGKLIIYKSDFYNLKFDEEEEIIADKFAAESINKVYGHVGGLKEGIEFFENQNLLSDSSFSITQKRKDEILKYSTIKKFDIKPTNKLNINIVDENNHDEIVNNTNPYANSINAKLLSEFLNKFNNILLEYDNTMMQYSNIMNLENNINQKELETRFEELNILIEKNSNYAQSLKSLLSSYDILMHKSVATDRSNINNSLFMIEWDKNKVSNENLIFSKFDNYKNLFLAQSRMLNFLIRRFGTFKIQNNVIYFDSVNASDQYKSLLERIEEFK